MEPRGCRFQMRLVREWLRDLGRSRAPRSPLSPSSHGEGPAGQLAHRQVLVEQVWLGPEVLCV